MAMSAGVAVRDGTPGDAGVQVRSWRAGYRALMPGAVLEDLSVTAGEQRWTKILAARTPGVYTLVAATEGDVHGLLLARPPEPGRALGSRRGGIRTRPVAGAGSLRTALAHRGALTDRS